MKAVENSIKPLKEYLKTFEPYHELMAIQLDAYVANLKEGKKTLQDLRDEIVAQLQMQEQIELGVPNNVSTGMFHVNCDEVKFPRIFSEPQKSHRNFAEISTVVHSFQVRNYLINKRKALASAVLNRLVEKARQLSDKLNYEYGQISRKIISRPNSIEELTQQRDFMTSVPKQISGLKKKLVKMGVYYDNIEEVGLVKV